MDVAHYPLTSLEWSSSHRKFFKGSRVLLSMNPWPKTLVLLVHGWRGHAGTTWEAFPRAIRYLPKAENIDALFLHYPSVKHAASFCAGPVSELLLDLLRTSADSVINPSLPSKNPWRSPAFGYERIVIAGHSMGAAVARRALLDLDRDDLNDADRAKLTMIFFAPAHKGSSLPLLIESGLGLEAVTGAAAVGKALTIYYRSLHQLAEGSQFLTDLLEHSELARQRCKARNGDSSYLRAWVYHAANDKTVNPDPFDDDHRPRSILDRNHRQICKPDEAYRRPVTALEERLWL